MGQVALEGSGVPALGFASYLCNATCGFLGWDEAERTRAWRKRRKALKVRKKMHRVRHLDHISDDIVR